MRRMELKRIDGQFTIFKLKSVADIDLHQEFYF